MIEVLKQALEALEYIDNVYMSVPKLGHEAITSLRKAIQEEALRNVQRIGQEIEQEPVAQAFESTCSEALRAQGKPYPRTCKKCGLGPCIGKPHREWVELMDEEIDRGLLRTPYAMKNAEAWREGVRWAYHQLKEKNND